MFLANQSMKIWLVLPLNQTIFCQRMPPPISHVSSGPFVLIFDKLEVLPINIYIYIFGSFLFFINFGPLIILQLVWLD